MPGWIKSRTYVTEWHTFTWYRRIGTHSYRFKVSKRTKEGVDPLHSIEISCERAIPNRQWMSVHFFVITERANGKRSWNGKPLEGTTND